MSHLVHSCVTPFVLSSSDEMVTVLHSSLTICLLLLWMVPCMRMQVSLPCGKATLTSHGCDCTLCPRIPGAAVMQSARGTRPALPKIGSAAHEADAPGCACSCSSLWAATTDMRTATLYKLALALPLWASPILLECRLLPQVPLTCLSDVQCMMTLCCHTLPAEHERLQNGLCNWMPSQSRRFCAATTLTATYNDLDSVRQVFEANKDEIAGVILEPVVGNSGFIPPTQEFLEVTSTCASPPHC